MRYYIVVGEASGDLHASNLMRALLEKDPAANFRYFGGDRMLSIGGTLAKHYRELAFMGFWEFIKNLRTILGNLAFCKKDIANFNPDAVIFVDYPGFNLRLAKWAKTCGYQTHYYISPQLWAWKESRVSIVKKWVDSMYVILPFEKEFYEKRHHFHVNFVGHPLLDALQQYEAVDAKVFRKQWQLDERPIIALLPGSRGQEIKKMLATMTELSSSFSTHQFVIAGAPSQSKSVYEPYLKQGSIAFVENVTYDLLQIAEAALVASGTATLETALFRVPQVVCYKSSKFSFWIARLLIRHLKFISLVNLVLDREAVKELIQDDFTIPNLSKELSTILTPESKLIFSTNYDELANKLGRSGASAKTAQLIFDSLR